MRLRKRIDEGGRFTNSVRFRLLHRKQGNIPPSWNLNMKNVALSIGCVILLQPVSKLPRIGPHNVVFAWIEARSTLKDFRCNLVFGDSGRAVNSASLIQIDQKR